MDQNTVAQSGTSLAYDREVTAVLVIDPYNDFISEGGKVWDRIKAVAEANGCVPHMRQVLDAARKAGLRVFYPLYHRYAPGDYETWKYTAPIQKAAWRNRTFARGTWGGEIRGEFEPQPGDVVVQEHWCSSGFANTDLDLQLKRQGIQRLIVIGLIAHTCVEATVRYGDELGYDVTVVRDATADYSVSEENNRAIGPVAEKQLGPEGAKKLLSQSFVAGPPINVQFMVKDSKKYASSGGWGFAQFDDGKPAGEAVHKTCFACHAPAKDRDFVFTRYSP